MRKAIAIFLVGCLIGAPTVVLAVKVTAVPAAVAKKYSIDTKWYKKYTTVHAMGFDVSATYDWTDKDSIQFSASSPLRVEQGSLVIESPYDREKSSTFSQYPATGLWRCLYPQVQNGCPDDDSSIHRRQRTLPRAGHYPGDGRVFLVVLGFKIPSLILGGE